MTYCYTEKQLSDHETDLDKNEEMQEAIEEKASKFFDLMIKSNPWDEQVIVKGEIYTIADFLSDHETDQHLMQSFLRGDFGATEQLKGELNDALYGYCENLAIKSIENGE